MEKSPSKKTPSPTAQPFVPGRQATRTSSFTSPPALAPSNADTTTASKPRVNLPASQVPCRYFAAGYCQRGLACFYKHDLSSVTLPGLENADKGKETREPENTDTCAICYEMPTTYGLLTSCDHVFCLSCIRAWRSTAAPDAVPDSEGGVLSKTSKTCPLCRVRSKFIIPSSVFPRPVDEAPDEGEKINPAKDAIIAAYLARLKTIPCRHFTNSLLPNAPPRLRRDLPDCPFGNDCHYKHTFRGFPYVFSDSELSAQRRRRTQNHRRMGWVERLLFGATYDPGSDLPLPSPPWPVSEAEARTLMEIILEGGDPPEWDEFEEDEDEDEDEEDDYYDIDDSFEPDWEQRILNAFESSVPQGFNSRSRWAQGAGEADENDDFTF